MTARKASWKGVRARPMSLLGLLVAALAAAGCRNALEEQPEPERDFWGRPIAAGKDDPLPPSFDPIVIPRPGTRGGGPAPESDDPSKREEVAVDAEDQGWQEKLDLVNRLVTAGDDEQALTVLDAAISARPPATWSARFKDLKQEVRARRIEAGLLRLDARPVKDVVPFATEVRFVVRIRNVSDADVVFSAPEAATGPVRARVPRDDPSPSALTLDVVRRDRDIYAAMLERSWTRTVSLQAPGDPPLRLAPGELREFPVAIPAEDVGAPIAGVRHLEVSGTLRPTGLTVGGRPEAVTLRVRRGRVVVLPQGFEPLAADPLGGMQQALPLGAAAHVLVATEFVPRDQTPQAVALLARALVEGEPVLVTAAIGALGMLRERCVGDPLAPLVEPLFASLENRPDRTPDLLRGLAMLTDARLAADARLWQDWWRRTRPHAPVVTPPGTEADAAAVRATAEPAR